MTNAEAWFNNSLRPRKPEDLHLKPISHSVAVSIQETASQLTDELPVYNSTQQSNSEKNGLPSSFLTKQEE